MYVIEMLLCYYNFYYKFLINWHITYNNNYKIIEFNYVWHRDMHGTEFSQF